jgi:hypothetical protein
MKDAAASWLTGLPVNSGVSHLEAATAHAGSNPSMATHFTTRMRGALA